LEASSVAGHGLLAKRRGRRGPLAAFIAALGPAFVAAVAYIDPGNFATNVEGGARYGYLLVWVVLAANLMAMLVQYLAAKVGIATGLNLPELCRKHLPRPLVWFLWLQAEFVAIATDLAEFVGAAIALNLLFGVPMFIGGLITAVVAFGLLALQTRGYRRFEIAIIGLLALVFLGLIYDLCVVGFSPSGIAKGMIPHFSGSDSVMLAVGILGATVMPHIIYLHSALTQNRIKPKTSEQRKSLLKLQRSDVLIALGLAGLINLAMLVIAAELFHTNGVVVNTIEGTHSELARLVGGGAALAFAVALLASGLSSSSVGTYAGQVIMQGFIGRHISLFLRRAFTMAPALIVLAIGWNTTQCLIISQVVLSFGIPFALIPLIWLTCKRELMGELVNRYATTITACLVAAIVIGFNGYLVYDKL
jgi:manganese transport protein